MLKRGWVQRIAAAVLAGALGLWLGASCVRTEVRPQDGTRLRDLTFAPGTKAYKNEMPEPVRPAGAKPPQSIPLTVKPPENSGPPGPPGLPGPGVLNPLQQEKDEARKYLKTQPAPGKLICTALDPASRRPLMALIRVVAADKTAEAMTDPVTGMATFEIAAGRTQVYCAAGEYFTPFTDELDVQPGENQLEVLLTQVPDLSPSRFGFSTVALAVSARQDRVPAERRMKAGQADFAFVLEKPAQPQTQGAVERASGTPVAVDGPYAGSGSRFAGLGGGPAPRLMSQPAYDRAPAAGAPGDAVQPGCAPLWDDLHRLKQAGFLRVWLYPGGVATRPELVQALKLPERQFVGSEAYLAAERGPGIELVTLGAQGEGEREYFELLNRGLTVAAMAEPVTVDGPGGGARTGTGAAARGAGESYQSLPADLYDTVVTPRTLVRIDGWSGTGASAKGPELATALAWLKAGQAQVAYGPVIVWRMREFQGVVGYAAQPVPAADRMYHLDVSAFIGPGAPPEFRSIQLIELVRNGTVVAALPVDRPLQTVRDLTFEIHETASCWYMLRAYSGAPRENRSEVTGAPAHWRRSWSAPIHFAAVAAEEAPVGGGRELPVAVQAFDALDGIPLAAAEVVVTRGGFLVTKTLLKGGRGTVEARVGDHILVGAKDRAWRETVVSPYENRNGDPWRAIDAEPVFGAETAAPVEDARAANARLSGLGLLVPLVRREKSAEKN